MKKKLEFRFSKDILIIRRKLLNYTKVKMAHLSGVSKQAYAKWESGMTEPSSSNITRLAKIFKTSPKQMLIMDLKSRETKYHAG